MATWLYHLIFPPSHPPVPAPPPKESQRNKPEALKDLTPGGISSRGAPTVVTVDTDGEGWLKPKRKKTVTLKAMEGISQRDSSVNSEYLGHSSEE